MQRGPDDLRATVLRFRRAQGERYLAQLAGDVSHDPSRDADFVAPCHPDLAEAYVEFAGEMDATEHAALGAHIMRAYAERAYVPGRRAAAGLATRPGAHGSQRKPLAAWWTDLAVLTREAGRDALRATTRNALATAPNALGRPKRAVRAATSEAFALLKPGRHADAGPEGGNAELARRWLRESADLTAEATRQAARLSGIELRHEVDLMAALVCVRLSSHVRRETRGQRVGEAWEAFGWRSLLSRRARMTRPHYGCVPAAHVVVGGGAETLQITPSAVEFGVVSELAVLEATGRALGILLVSSALPFELRQPTVASVARACGGLAVAAMTHPEPWRRRHGANKRDAHSLAQVAAAQLLCRTRLAAAAVLAQGEGMEAQQQLAAEALAVDVAPEVASVLLSGLFPGGSMRALCHVPDLAAALRCQFDEDWLRNPRAAEPLMGALLRGGGHSVEAFAEDLGVNAGAGLSMLGELF